MAAIHPSPAILSVFLLPFYSKSLKEFSVPVSSFPPFPSYPELIRLLSLLHWNRSCYITHGLLHGFLMPSYLTLFLSSVWDGLITLFFQKYFPFFSLDATCPWISSYFVGYFFLVSIITSFSSIQCLKVGVSFLLYHIFLSAYLAPRL